MAYGMKIYNSDDTLAYDSTSPGGVFVRYVVLSAGTSHIDSPGSETFPAAYIGRNFVIYPLVLGNHYWYFGNGNIQSGQVPELMWYDDRYIAPGIQRKSTILMVLVK